MYRNIPKIIILLVAIAFRNSIIIPHKIIILAPNTIANFPYALQTIFFCSFIYTIPFYAFYVPYVSFVPFSLWFLLIFNIFYGSIILIMCQESIYIFSKLFGHTFQQKSHESLIKPSVLSIIRGLIVFVLHLI